jgi:uncharacterized protein YndB with AHSA1/START domain
MLCADLTIAISAPAERVFEALTKGKELVRWWPNAAASDLVPGEPYRFEFRYSDGELVRSGVCISAVPAKNVALTWPDGAHSVIEFLLVPDRTPSCTLRLVHVGFGQAQAEMRAAQICADIWPGLLEKLRNYLEKGIVEQALAGPESPGGPGGGTTETSGA